jgi:NADPH:quinone reductase-like Zn-dependent oxidoreductase
MDALLDAMARRLVQVLPGWVLADIADTHIMICLATAATLLPPLAAYIIWMFALKPLLPPAPPTSLKRLKPGDFCVSCGTGGYEALQAHALPAGAATQGAVPEGHVATPLDKLVTVRVRAAGVNYADVCIRWGLYASWNKFGGGTGTCTTSENWPSEARAIQNVPGFEFAGTVEQVGSSVTNVKVGDEIFGVTLFGAYSSRLVVPAHQVFRRPRGLTAPQAAGLPAVAMTAYFAVMRQASPINRGERVLVHSGAGGVGSMLIQMCKIQGWRVCAVVGSPHKTTACKELGADCVIDKSTSDLWREAASFAPNGYAAVFDANGIATLQQSWEHLAPCGKLIVYGFQCVVLMNL